MSSIATCCQFMALLTIFLTVTILKRQVNAAAFVTTPIKLQSYGLLQQHTAELSTTTTSTHHYHHDRCLRRRHGGSCCSRCCVASLYASSSSRGSSRSGNEWNGEVVPNADGKINGCSIQPKPGSVTEWIVTIDGVEADLGRFSQAIYKKIISDAKQQRFQGFRPGTIPPHLEPTYRAFTMDECARETILEALQQNKIRPFESARMDMTLENFYIPAPDTKKGSSSKKKKSKQNSSSAVAPNEPEQGSSNENPQWLQFEDMKGAIDGGWKPGQSFSFVAKNVKGQQIKDETETAGATPLGVNY